MLFSAAESFCVLFVVVAPGPVSIDDAILVFSRVDVYVVRCLRPVYLLLDSGFLLLALLFFF